ncbi:MAG: flagellar basal body L-ring protein FlgH [Rubellimicrobium sp.]|nr:flagellar basal body L-ring protein FlgH [Rubellimicrobium sp.]
MLVASLFAVGLLAACEGASPIGTPPDFSPATATPEQMAMMTPGMGHDPAATTARSPRAASLWTGERGSLLGDNRAIRRGDILTVVIAIDDQAAISNSSSRGRDGTQQMGVQAFFGREARADVPLDPAVQLDSGSAFSGEGSVRRNERLTLRVAATVIEMLPSGVLAISGRQEVRVNNELRELLVSGYVRPADITRQNEVSYDKIAAARISYGGRGQISDMQQPRWGQQVLDLALPF